MIRPTKCMSVVVLLALVACLSFRGGERLRHIAAGPIVMSTGLSSASSANIGGAMIRGETPEAEEANPAETFREVYQYVKEEYVDRVEDDSKLSAGAVRVMLASLDDPKTRYLDGPQLKALEDQMNGTYSGIGAVVSVVKQKKGAIDQRRLAVVSPAEGGPAARAGVLAGDIITHVDDKWIIAYDPREELVKMQTKEMSDTDYRKILRDLTKQIADGISLSKALDLLAAKDGKKLQLTLERVGAAEPIKLSLTTLTVATEPVEYRPISDRVDYVRVTQFASRSAASLREALEKATHRALILDLRNNPGAPVAADETLPPAARLLLAGLSRGGKVASLLTRSSAQQNVTVRAEATRPRRLAVLINSGTSNVAEVVAAALKSRSSATLVGSRTFGDSVMQRLVTLRSGGAMTLTAGKYLTAEGKDFTGTGIEPDLPAAAGAGDPAASDPVVERALRALTGA